MIFIDKFAYKSRLKGIDPVQKLVFVLLTLAVCLWADNGAISVLVLFIMGVGIVFRGGTPFGFFIKMMLMPMTFLAIGLLTIVVNISQDPDVFLTSLPIANTRLGITYEGVHDAFGMFLKALGSVSCLYFLSLTTPMVDLLAVLRKLKVPKLLVELMGLVYRFIFVLLETADLIFTAQNSRLGYSNIRSGYRSLGALASSLFIRAYKRSDELYTALEARGYDGELKVLMEPYESHWAGYALAVAVNVLLITIALILK